MEHVIRVPQKCHNFVAAFVALVSLKVLSGVGAGTGVGEKVSMTIVQYIVVQLFFLPYLRCSTYIEKSSATDNFGP